MEEGKSVKVQYSTVHQYTQSAIKSIISPQAHL